MTIEEVLREMRDWKWGLSPRVRAWADTIEAAMRERDAEIERLRADAESCRKDAERMREAIKEAKTAMADYADATAYAILKAALEANPPRA